MRDSFSLKNYLQTVYDRCYPDGLGNVRQEYSTSFSDNSPFTTDLEMLLHHKFWQV